MSQSSGQLIDIWSRESLSKHPDQLRNEIRELNIPENRSLRLAEKENFFGMCEQILWGNEDRQAFGELLRGAVTSFLPTDRFQLSLLHNIVAIQWQIVRIVGIQHNLFERGCDTPGAFRLPQGTHDAMQYNKELGARVKDLEKAIQAYRMMSNVESSRKVSNGWI